MRLKLTGPGPDLVRILDTPTPDLIGPWLKAIFDDVRPDPHPAYPIEFHLEIR